jgi:hypothetical protein
MANDDGFVKHTSRQMFRIKEHTVLNVFSYNKSNIPEKNIAQTASEKLKLQAF